MRFAQLAENSFSAGGLFLIVAVLVFRRLPGYLLVYRPEPATGARRSPPGARPEPATEVTVCTYQTRLRGLRPSRTHDGGFRTHRPSPRWRAPGGLRRRAPGGLRTGAGSGLRAFDQNLSGANGIPSAR